MRHTLAEARTLVKPFVDSGTCRTEVIDARINEALERLLDASEWESLRRLLRLSVVNRTFVMPPMVDKILWVDTNGVPAKVFSSPYQFLSSGPGDLTYQYADATGYRDVVDLDDHWSVMYEVPATETGDLNLIALSDGTETEEPELTLLCRDTEHELTGLGAASTLAIHPIPAGLTLAWTGTWAAALGTAEWSDFTTKHVDRVTKPATVGTIHLLAVNPETLAYYRLGIYYPTETLPQFHRYQLTNFSCSGEAVDVLALVRLKFAPLTAADDELPLDGLQALKLMVIAIREENAGNLAGATTYFDAALKLLTTKEERRTMHVGTPTVLDCDYRASLGRAMNRGGLVL